MRADRLIALMLLLEVRGRMTTQQLADALEVSRRTILRDVDALSSAGVPLYTEGGHGGGVALDEQYRVSLTGLMESEVRALFVSQNAALLNEVGMGQATESTLLKLFAALPHTHRQSVDYIRQRIYIDPHWWWQEQQPLPFLDALQQAVYEDHRIRVTYQHHNGTVVERLLSPYSLVAKMSVWYLIAKRDGALRTYRVSRIRAVEVLDDCFERDADFDLTTYWTTHVQQFRRGLVQYRFTLRLPEPRLSFIEWYFPGRSHVITPPDDTGYFTTQFETETPELARMFVLGLGTDAEVVAPSELHESVVAVAQEIVRAASINQ